MYEGMLGWYQTRDNDMGVKPHQVRSMDTWCLGQDKPRTGYRQFVYPGAALEFIEDDELD